MRTNQYSVKVARGRDEFYKIEGIWNDITQAMERKRYYHVYQWYKSYIESAENQRDNVYFFLIFKDNTPVGIIPLVKIKTREFWITFTFLEIPGTPYYFLLD